MGQGDFRTPSQTDGQPQQAVVLAGGRGHRLAPISDLRPKPMTRFAGRPFLEHLMLDLRSQGIRQFLFLLGYQAEAIRRYFAAGSAWNVDIRYSVQPRACQSGCRLWRARDWLQPTFLLTYCDNIWPYPADLAWSQFTSRDVSMQMTVYRNRDGYTRSNVRVEDGLVRRYDPARQQDDLNGVEIGYSLCRRDVVAHLSSDEDSSLQHDMFPKLIRNKAMGAFVTDQRYYSVGRPERLAQTAQYLASSPTVLVDRDGVLNARMPRAEYVETWSDWRWLPGALEGLRMFHERGYRVILISNQAGVARGKMTRAALDAIHARMAYEVESADGFIEAIYVCDHSWDAACECRKPKPGMLLQAQRDFCLNLRETPYLGDDDRDAEAAEAAGCPFIAINDECSLIDAARRMLEERDSRLRRFDAAPAVSPARRSAGPRELEQQDLPT